MIPKHKEKEFKLQLAARVKLQHERTGENMIDILLDVYSAFRREGIDTIILGPDGLFRSREAFYQFTYDHADDIQAVLSEIGETSTESAISDFLPPIDVGGREREGGSARREMTSDDALKAKDDDEFTTRTLKAFVRELGLKITDAVAAKIRKYATALNAGRK